MTLIIDGLGDLKTKVGQHLGYSDWFQVTQERIAAFADATDDHQWITSTRSGRGSGPYGDPIAHGYLPCPC